MELVGRGVCFGWIEGGGVDGSTDPNGAHACTPCLSAKRVQQIAAFIAGWDMTLVLLAMLPVLGTMGALTAVLSGRVTRSAQKAYARAADVVTQALQNVRAVHAFNAEQYTIEVRGERFHNYWLGCRTCGRCTRSTPRKCTRRAGQLSEPSSEPLSISRPGPPAPKPPP